MGLGGGPPERDLDAPTLLNESNSSHARSMPTLLLLDNDAATLRCNKHTAAAIMPTSTVKYNQSMQLSSPMTIAMSTDGGVYVTSALSLMLKGATELDAKG